MIKRIIVKVPFFRYAYFNEILENHRELFFNTGFYSKDINGFFVWRIRVDIESYSNNKNDTDELEKIYNNFISFLEKRNFKIITKEKLEQDVFDIMKKHSEEFLRGEIDTDRLKKSIKNSVPISLKDIEND